MDTKTLSSLRSNISSKLYMAGTPLLLTDSSASPTPAITSTFQPEDLANDQVVLKSPYGFDTLSQAINTLFTVALFLGALAALGYIVYGAFLFVTAAGDQTKVDRARQIIVRAIVGLLLFSLVLVIFQLVIQIVPGLSRFFGYS